VSKKNKHSAKIVVLYKHWTSYGLYIRSVFLPGATRIQQLLMKTICMPITN